MLQVKDGLRDDSRYKAVKHEEREALFNAYISELKAADDEVEREAKAKREEQVLDFCRNGHGLDSTSQRP